MATSKIPYIPHCNYLGILANNTDLDTITDWSISKLVSNNTYTNIPTEATYGMLEVISITSLRIQRLTSGSGIWVRVYGNNAWAAWKKYTPD